MSNHNQIDQNNVTIIIPRTFTILLDMDGVIAHIFFQIHKMLRERHPHFVLKSLEEQENHRMSVQYPEYATEIHAIFSEKGFFRSLPPIEDAIETILGIANKHNVIICTQPYNSPYCEREKKEWKNEYLGKKLPIVLAHDKTHHRGDYIVEDNPEMSGEYLNSNPWEHIIFDQSYNRRVEGKRRINGWKRYGETLPELL